MRLRLTQSEVAGFAVNGRVEEAIEFGIEPQRRFIYALEITNDAETVSASFENSRITVFVPKARAEEWTQTGRVGIESEQPIGDGKILRLLIEKDFACLEPRAGEDETDAFPHPSEGKAC